MLRDDDPIELVVEPVPEPALPSADEDVIDVGHQRRLDAWAARASDRVRARVGRVPLRAKIAAGVGVVVLAGGGITAWQLTRPAPPKPVVEAAPPVGLADNAGVPYGGWHGWDTPQCASGTVAAIDTTPPATAVAAVQRHLPEFMIRGGAQSFDESGRACGAVLHARDGEGSRFILLLTAPPSDQPPGQTMDLEVGAVDVVVVTHSGWRVEVSVVGYSTDLPPAAALSQLAHDPHLVS